jgi:hypothetical protein
MECCQNWLDKLVLNYVKICYKLQKRLLKPQGPTTIFCNEHFNKLINKILGKLGNYHVVSHREELIQCLTPRKSLMRGIGIDSPRMVPGRPTKVLRKRSACTLLG